jgi:hypothetical protein
MKFYIGACFGTLSRAFKFRKNTTRITGTSYEDQYTFLIYLTQLFLMKNFSKFLEKIKGRTLCSIRFSSKIVPFMRKCGKTEKSRAGHSWQYGACAFHARYLSYKHTLAIMNRFCFSTATMVALTSLVVTSYVHCLSGNHCLTTA